MWQRLGSLLWQTNISNATDTQIQKPLNCLDIIFQNIGLVEWQRALPGAIIVCLLLDCYIGCVVEGYNLEFSSSTLVLFRNSWSASIWRNQGVENILLGVCLLLQLKKLCKDFYILMAWLQPSPTKSASYVIPDHKLCES